MCTDSVLTIAATGVEVKRPVIDFQFQSVTNLYIPYPAPASDRIVCFVTDTRSIHHLVLNRHSGSYAARSMMTIAGSTMLGGGYRDDATNPLNALFKAVIGMAILSQPLPATDEARSDGGGGGGGGDSMEMRTHSFLVCDNQNHLIRLLDIRASRDLELVGFGGRVTTVIGSGTPGAENGFCSEYELPLVLHSVARIADPRFIVRDPNPPSKFAFKATPPESKSVAVSGEADGAGGDAKETAVTDVFYITARNSIRKLQITRRFTQDSKGRLTAGKSTTGQMTTVPRPPKDQIKTSGETWKAGDVWNPFGLGITPLRILIITNISDSTVYGVDPDSGHAAHLSGSDHARHSSGMYYPFGLTVVQDPARYETYALISEFENHRITKQPLPRHFFERLPDDA